MTVRQDVASPGACARAAASVRQSNDCSVVRSTNPSCFSTSTTSRANSAGGGVSPGFSGESLVSRLRRTGLPLALISCSNSASVG